MFSTVNYESATSLIVFSVAQSVYKYSHSLLIASHFFVCLFICLLRLIKWINSNRGVQALDLRHRSLIYRFR